MTGQTGKRNYGFSDNIGIEDVGFVGSQYKVGLQLRPDHLNGNGILHGGVVSTLLDACMARVFFLGLLPEETDTFKHGVTVEMKINFLRTTGSGYVYALGTMVKRGRTMSYTEGELFDEKGSLLAKSSATMMIVRK